MAYLLDVFNDHSKEFMNGGRYCSEDFNLPCALYTIVKEIMELNDRLVGMENI